jgi:serine/threonine protein kinase
VLQQNNVIHRDIKPANILIKNGVAKITDFGFARIVDNVDDKVAHTFLGSPLYMSPEILAKKEFSAKCDVWSLGMTFYEMLYGRTPWTAGNIPALL